MGSLLVAFEFCAVLADGEAPDEAETRVLDVLKLTVVVGATVLSVAT